MEIHGIRSIYSSSIQYSIGKTPLQFQLSTSDWTNVLVSRHNTRSPLHAQFGLLRIT